MDVNKKDVESFEKLCKSRLRMGQKKYPNMLHKQNMFKQFGEELADCANYSTLLYCKIKEIERRVLKELGRKKV